MVIILGALLAIHHSENSGPGGVEIGRYMNVQKASIEHLDTEAKVSAAKIHVLGLTPLKVKLGPKWDRLAGLVHKLFETAIARAQGPYDHFIALDELSYAVTFHSLSPDEASLACVAIAKDVCALLFGKEIDEISVRSIVVGIVESLFAGGAGAAKSIEAAIEQGGAETVVTQSTHSGSVGPEISVPSNVPEPLLAPIRQIEGAHSKVAELGLRMGFFPVWELGRGESNSLFLAPFRGSADHVIASGRRALDGLIESRIAEIEIVLLSAASAYAERLYHDKKVCAVGVGVSYETLSGFQTRIRYLTALQKVKAQPSTPILLKIEQVCEGTPLARIAELVAMLKMSNMRVTVEFQSLGSIPDIDIRLGAIGIGGTIPRGADGETAMLIAEKLVRRAANQKMFAYLDHLDLARYVEAANRHNVRFGTGLALGTQHFAGVEKTPNFPLTTVKSG